MTRTRRLGFGSDKRAVSELVGFIFVFGIILVSVGLLTVTGFQALDDFQENERIANSERAMDALADNFNDVVRYDGITERFGELALREGTVTTSANGTNVTINDGNDPLDSTYENISLGEFRYDQGSDAVVYDGGAVIREGETGSVVVREPMISCSGDTATVSLLKITNDEGAIQTQDGLGFTITENTETTNRTVEHDVDLNVTADAPDARQDAWDELETECDDVTVVVTVVEAEITS